MFKQKDIGIDLGTANILIYVKGEGIVLSEPSVIAVSEDTNNVLAIGEEAHKMLGRTPGSVIAIKPLKDGVIADFKMTELMINYFIKKIKAKRFIFKPRILICCPTNITQVEKNAIREVAERTGAKKVYLEEEVKAAALGSGLDVMLPSGNMVIDIGGGTTDIAVISLNGIVYSESIKVAGNKFDLDIINYIKNKYKLLIGEVTAESIKIDLPNYINKSKKVKGRDLITGLPKTIEIKSQEIKDAMKDSIYLIINTAKSVLEKIKPEIAADIIENGIILTGGGALLDGLESILKKELKVPVTVAIEPLTSVVNGTAILLENI